MPEYIGLFCNEPMDAKDRCDYTCTCNHVINDERLIERYYRKHHNLVNVHFVAMAIASTLN